MLAAVATEEPLTAPNAPEAAIAAIDSPPRNPVSATRAASKRSRDMREPDATSPIRTKSGITDKA